MGGKVLVTGASGFVGGHLLPMLVANGFVVVAPVRRAPAPQDGVQFPLIETIEAVDWRPLMSGVDAAIHLAGIAHTQSAAAAQLYDRVNAQASARLAKQCEGRVGRFIFISSIRAMTGSVSAEALDEESPEVPTDAYGRSKLNAERAIAGANLPSTILRPVAVYGEGVKGNLALIQRLADSPLPLPFAALRAERSFLSIQNLVSAIEFALARPGLGSEMFVLADPEPGNVADLIIGLRQGLGRAERILSCSPRLLSLAAGVIGQGSSWTTFAGRLSASPRKFRAAGWSPVVETSLVGARLWGESRKANQRRKELFSAAST